MLSDWEQRKQMKYKEPTLGKGIRTLFRKNNYNVFLVDEFLQRVLIIKLYAGMKRPNFEPIFFALFVRT